MVTVENRRDVSEQDAVIFERAVAGDLANIFDDSTDSDHSDVSHASIAAAQEETDARMGESRTMTWDDEDEEAFGHHLDSGDEDDDNENCNPEQQDLDEPLYEGAPITAAESLIAILDLSLRHNITGALLTDILQLIELHCPPDNKCTTTLYKFNKYFAEMQDPLIRHFYCTECHRSVEQQNDICPACVGASKISYFIEGPITAQIRAMFKRPGFTDKLQCRVTRDRTDLENLKDIYDGEVYKELSHPTGILAIGQNISFTWYTDGIAIFKSSKFNIWVVYLVINELPFSERHEKENVLFAGLWFGEKKPLPNLFLKPLRSSLQELREGIDVQVPNSAVPVHVKGIVICGTCDLPAKALFLNMKQFNGKFGCQKCKQEGEYLLPDRVRVYPYERVALRSDEETRMHAQDAHENGIAVCGVKGPTILDKMVHQNMRAIAVDVMHCVFEGVVKSLLSIWFTSNYSDHPASMIEHIDLIDWRLTFLTPPSSVQRLPRSIKNHLNYWKAHELKTWFFYHSIPCLQDVMNEVYFDHYLLLVLGISLLCKSSITPDELDIASRSLDEFVSMFENLYYRRNMSNNLHQLLHLAENVRQFGPLWTTSCFPFEDLNGRLKRLVHGSNSAQLQIYSAVSKMLILTTLKSEKLIPGRPVYQFSEDLNYKHGRIKRHRVTESVYIVGTCNELRELPRDIDDTLQRSGVIGRRCFGYKRLLKKKTMFASTEYRRSTRSNSTYALYAIRGEPDRIGKIRCFVRIAACACPGLCSCEAQNYAILNPCVLENRFSTSIDSTVLSTVHSILDLECYQVAVHIDQLKSVCYYCRIQDIAETFVIEPVNLIEAE